MTAELDFHMSAAAPVKKRGVCLPFAKWPPLDRAAWEKSCIPGTPFEQGGIASVWALSTRRVTAAGWGRYLQWLGDRGELDATIGPEDRVSRESAASYAQDLFKVLSPMTVGSYIQQLADALRAMGGDHDWGWVMRASWRIREEAVPVRDKRSRMQSPERLAGLGRSIMAGAESQLQNDPIEAAMEFRSGLSIAFLAYRPIRVGNLSAIVCGQHLIKYEDRWWLIFAAHEVKNRRPLEFHFPDELVPFLERYLSLYRPILLACADQHDAGVVKDLWISRDGGKLGVQTLSYHIQRQTEAAFGLAINPHLFRDCAATMIATVAPEHVGIIASILGHATPETSERHYNQAKGLETGRQHNKTLQKLMKEASRTRKAEKRIVP